MSNRFLLATSFALLVVATSSVAQTSAPSNFNGQSWWEYVKVLASDDMEGRETGSAGLQKASAYVVEQLKKSGLEPAGTKGFYQPVQFISRQIDESGSSLALVNAGKWDPLESTCRHASLSIL